MLIDRWADKQCRQQQLEPNRKNLRKVLGKATKMIRFTLLTPHEFWVVCGDSHEERILDAEEIHEIYM